MKKAQLIKLLEEADDSDEILMEGFSHTYHRTYLEYVTYLEDPKTGTLTEDFGEKATPSSVYGERKNGIKIVQI